MKNQRIRPQLNAKFEKHAPILHFKLNVKTIGNTVVLISEGDIKTASTKIFPQKTKLPPKRANWMKQRLTVINMHHSVKNAFQSQKSIT